MRRRALQVSPALVAVLIAAGAAWAYWSAGGAGSAPAAVGTLSAATISVPATSTGSVAVTWTGQASLPADPARDGSIAYRVERRLGAGAYAPVASGGCAGALPHGTASCTDTVTASGAYSYRVVATFAGAWTATSNVAGPVVATTDDTPPTVQSIVRAASSPTRAQSVAWTVTFSEPVTGVDAGDFALAASGVSGASLTGVSGAGSSYTVSADTGTGSGTLRLDLSDDDSIRDLALQPLGGPGAGNGSLAGQAYALDRTPPAVQSVVRASANPTRGDSLSWTVTFSEAVTGVDRGDFALAASGVGGAAISGEPVPVGAGGTTYTVSATTTSGTGTVGLNVLDDDSIVDGAGTPLAAGFAGQVYDVDRTAPALSKLEMLDVNANGRVDQVVATFNEALSASTATAPWTLANVPSGGTLAGASVAGTTATLTLAEGAGAANTAVGAFTVALAAGGVRDAAGNDATFAAQAPQDRAKPAIAALVLSNVNRGTAGQPERGDSFAVTFSEALRAASMCAAWTSDSSNQGVSGNDEVTVTLSNGSGASPDSLSVSTAASAGCGTFRLGTINLGNNGYTSGTVTFRGGGNDKSTIAWSPSARQLTVTLGQRSGTVGTVASSVATLSPDAGVTDPAANGVAGAFSTANVAQF